LDEERIELAEWDAAYINDLPDSAFACIDPGGDKDDEGKTVPRSLRHYPHHNAAGDVDMPHLRNAMSRVAQQATTSCGNDHLESHAGREGVGASADDIITLNVANETLQTLSLSKRRMGLRLLPYNTVAVHPKYGPLLFEPGAFGEVDPKTVRLRMDHADPPTGLGESYDDKPDAPYMEFLVSKTERGNDQLTLASDGVSRGASVGYSEIAGRTKRRRIGGQDVTVYPPNSAVLAEVSTTWQPTFEGSGVMYVLHRDEEGAGPVAEPQEAPTNGAAPVITPGIDYTALTESIVAAQRDGARDEKIDKRLGAFEEMVELQRSQFSVPPAADAKPKPPLHNWVEYTLRRMAGDHFGSAELKTLALDDVITTEQPGLVPSVFTADYDDLINQDRPFLSSTREVAPPRTGNSMTLPIITTRAVAGTQAGGEKTDLTTTATKVGTGTFNYQSVFGGADISIQMINRAEPSFFDVLTGDLAMAYALDAENKAVDALLAGYTDSASVAHAPANGGTLDPENLSLGTAWSTSISVYKRGPDTNWLSSAAVAQFIDAKASGTNAPLYSDIAANFTAGGGPGGLISGLRPIYVPALDDESVDVIVGPSRGFVWAEDPARRLTADVPEKAGRDIVLAGGIFPAPRFADAFTVYAVGS
jgi:phage head maturation protease